MPFINPGHFWLILLLLIVVLIIWGPGKLPDVGAGMGKAIREFRKATNEAKDAIAHETSSHGAPSPPPPAPSSDGPSTPPSTAASAPRSEVPEEPRTTV